MPSRLRLLEFSIFILLALVVVVGCWQLAGKQADLAAVYKKVTKPKIPLDLLKNIKTVIDENLLLREEFYSVQTMSQFFGVEDGGVLVDEEISLKTVTANKFGYLVNLPDGSTQGFCGNGFAAGIRTGFGNKTSAGVGMHFNVGGPSYSEVESIFGSGWTKDNSPPPSGRMFPGPRMPHGYEVWIYEFDTKLTKRTLRIEFHRDGTIEFLNLTEEMK